MNSELLQILKSELKPALGCLGPVFFCYCAAEAYDAVGGGEIKRIVAKADWGICKTDDVAFPGTPYLGSEMAIAMGAVCGDPKAGMEVLKGATPEGEKKARKVAELVDLQPMFDRPNMGVFADITVETDLGTGRAVIENRGDGIGYSLYNMAGPEDTFLPIVSLGKDLGSSDEAVWRALALSSLVGIAVIHRIGKSPAMCSCEVAAALGVAAGGVLLQGGTFEQVEIAIQNTIPSVFGCVCDGAKLACALRISSGTGIALEDAVLALKGVRLAFNQGVLSTSADESINMLGRHAFDGMIDSDRALAQELFTKRKIFPLQTWKTGKSSNTVYLRAVISMSVHLQRPLFGAAFCFVQEVVCRGIIL